MLHLDKTAVITLFERTDIQYIEDVSDGALLGLADGTTICYTNEQLISLCKSRALELGHDLVSGHSKALADASDDGTYVCMVNLYLTVNGELAWESKFTGASEVEAVTQAFTACLKN